MIDIIIPIWNQSKLTVRCLQTIREHTSTYRLILIDNGSQPQEWELIDAELQNHEQWHVIVNAANRGFVQAVNQGLKAATAEYIVLMNNDTEAVKGWAEKLMEPLQASDEIVMSGPLTTTTESWQGKYPKGKKGWVIRGSGMLAFFCTMFKKRLFDEIGLLDERFGIGFGDDDDFCMRTLNAGYQMALVQDLVIPHHHRSSFRKAFSETEIKEMQRNAMKTFRDKYDMRDKTDVVYVLGTGSRWDDGELRMSIRSFKRYFENLRNIVVVGEKPGWLQNVIHIPFPDVPNVNKDCRMMLKIKAACTDPRVSENFIFCNDDTLLLKRVKTEDFTGWHNGPIMYDAVKDREDHKAIGSRREAVGTRQTTNGTIFPKPSKWFDFVYNTGLELQKMGLPDNNYDKAHCPQPVNKAEFIEVMKSWDMERNNYTVWNIYLNSSKIWNGENIAPRAVKIYNPMRIEDLDKICQNITVLNYNDTGLNDSLKEWLTSYLPAATNYECFGMGMDRHSAARKWFATGCNYAEGVAIFAQFAPKNARLKQWFLLKKGTPIAEKKLKQTLQLWNR